MKKKEGAIRALQYRALRSLQAILEAEERRTREFDFLPLGTPAVAWGEMTPASA